MKIVISLLILALGIGWWIANSGKQSAPVPKPEEVYEPLHISSLFKQIIKYCTYGIAYTAQS